MGPFCFHAEVLIDLHRISGHNLKKYKTNKQKHTSLVNFRECRKNKFYIHSTAYFTVYWAKGSLSQHPEVGFFLFKCYSSPVSLPNTIWHYGIEIWIIPYGVSVTKRYVCRVWLLATQKPVNRLGWWKGKFALFLTPATVGEDGGHLSQGLSPTPGEQGVRVFIDKVGGGYMQKQYSHLQIGHQWSD